MAQGNNIYKWRRIIDEAYATMDDGPEDYLFRKDGKQKLVGSADNEPDEGEEELEEEETDGYRYREEVDYEEDNSKIWHYVKAPGEDEWTVVDRSPYAPVDQLAWDLLKNFHKMVGRWPNQREANKLEEIEHEHWKK